MAEQEFPEFKVGEPVRARQMGDYLGQGLKTGSAQPVVRYSPLVGYPLGDDVKPCPLCGTRDRHRNPKHVQECRGVRA